MGAIKMGIGFGLWQQGMPDAATLSRTLTRPKPGALTPSG